jgi:hypothetical protein
LVAKIEATTQHIFCSSANCLRQQKMQQLCSMSSLIAITVLQTACGSKNCSSYAAHILQRYKVAAGARIAAAMQHIFCSATKWLRQHKLQQIGSNIMYAITDHYRPKAYGGY